MNANRGRRGRSRARDQEGYEIVDLDLPPHLGPAAGSMTTRGARREVLQTWRQILQIWRQRIRRELYWLLAFLIVTLGGVLWLCFFPDMWKPMLNWLSPPTNEDTQNSGSQRFHSSTSLFAPTMPNTHPIISSAKQFTHPHYAQIRQYPTTSLATLCTDPTMSQTWVPGFYIVPVPLFNPQETLMPQTTSPSKASTTTLESQGTVMARPTSLSKSPAPTPQELQLQSQSTQSYSSSSSITMTSSKRKDKKSAFIYYGATILASSNHISFSEKLKIFCIKNTCRNSVKVARTCNSSMPETEQERKECEWCWDSSTHRFHPNGTALYIHCGELVDHSQKTWRIIGCLSLLPLGIIAAIMLKRCVTWQRKKSARSKQVGKPAQGSVPNVSGVEPMVLDLALINENQDHEAIEKSPKRCRLLKKRKRASEGEKRPDLGATEDRILIMPRALPYVVDTGIFSNVRDMGEGRLLSGGNSQEDSLGLSRTSSRRERIINSGKVANSGIARVPTISINRVRGSSTEEGQAEVSTPN